MKLSKTFALALGLSLLAGCTKDLDSPYPPGFDPAKPKSAATPKGGPALTPEAEAAKLYSGRCAVCHGASGKGDGAGAAPLKVKPRDYTDATWQASVSDEDISKIIVGGGAAVGKDPGMAANPDLADKPEVLKALVKKVRSFVSAEAFKAAGGTTAEEKPAEGDKPAEGEKAAVKPAAEKAPAAKPAEQK
ncbi:MAG: c-type cytochrome [Polyangiaceae bacterium]|nr:c-type cytochrome [Polyangiaceae bacterium]